MPVGVSPRKYSTLLSPCRNMYTNLKNGVDEDKYTSFGNGNEDKKLKRCNVDGIRISRFIQKYIET